LKISDWTNLYQITDIAFLLIKRACIELTIQALFIQVPDGDLSPFRRFSDPLFIFATTS